jgi:hypothetical protein
MSGDSASYAAAARYQPEVAAMHKGNLVFVDVRKAQQTAFLHVLCEGQVCKDQQTESY